MGKHSGAVHIARVVRKYKDREYVSWLLRRSYRDAGKVKHETLANLSALPTHAITALRSSLAGHRLVDADEAFQVTRSLPHGHVAAVWAMARKLGFPALLGPPGPERDLAMALVIARVVEPDSKLATTRWWPDTTLGADLGVATATTDQVYAAMDWLGERQDRIERTLAGRHLAPGGLVYYDLSSSWVEGRHCPLAAHGYSRDRKRGKAQIEYGLLTDPDGRPVAVEVFPGNTGDPATVAGQVHKLRDRFGVEHLVMVGDRGMLTAARIQALRELGGVGWITTLRAPAIAALAQAGTIQPSLFDQTNLAEVTHPDYPGERLVVCRNPLLGAERARKRGELLDATSAGLDKVAASVQAGKLTGAADIGVKVGRVLGRFKMAKHFTLDIGDTSFGYARNQPAIDAEAALDGIYVVRTSVAASKLDAAATVEAYKRLANVERDFRSLKTVDLQLRPVHHYLEQRVRAHVLVCMLAAYLVWHLRKAWAPLTFTDETPPQRTDPVAPAERSQAARRKASRRELVDGTPAHSFHTLLQHLATLARDDLTFTDPAHSTRTQIQKLANPTPTQRKAFELIEAVIPLTLT
jgi:Transposase DDE domain